MKITSILTYRPNLKEAIAVHTSLLTTTYEGSPDEILRMCITDIMAADYIPESEDIRILVIRHDIPTYIMQLGPKHLLRQPVQHHRPQRVVLKS